MKRFYLILTLLFNTVQLIAAQELGQPEVSNLLKQAQQAMDQVTSLSNRLTYNFYPTYSSNRPTESFSGKSIKHGDTYYTKIDETIFLTNIKDNKSLKLNAYEKLIVVGENNLGDQNALANLTSTYMKFFKTKTVKDQGSNWLCTLTTDAITQIPYGKVEILIEKHTNRLISQTLYFLSQYPYKTSDGTTKMGNPKLEILMSDYTTSISKSEKKATKFATYVSNYSTNVSPTALYKDFKVIQN